MNSFKKFRQLHQNPGPFVLGNIWDVSSAKAFETAGYQAIGVSSQALSNAFGYDDGENLPFSILLQLAKRVVETVNIPFSVDLEGGYSETTSGILDNITKLHDAGVVGINIEDTVAKPARKFQPVADFQKKLSAITDHISNNNLNVFVNVRTDAFLLGLPTALDETIGRLKGYEKAGANGIFVPCITNSDDIKQVVNATNLPVNVMCMPNLPGFDELGRLGVKRISMGPFLFNKVYHHVAELAKAITGSGNFSPLFS